MVLNSVNSANKIEISFIDVKLENNENAKDILYEYEEAIDLAGNGWYNRSLLTVLSIGLLGMAIDIFGFSVVVTGSSCDFHLELWQKSNGWYNRGLLTVLSIGLLGMAIDIFGFSVVVTGSSCDFHLELWQKSILLSMPFVGPILMSIPWGYISDTKGRKRTLLIALWGSFLSSFISAFSPNWVMLAVLKVLSSCFCSTVQSVAYALLGESCSKKVRGFYMLIMTSVLMLFLLSYVVPGYFILQLSFASDLGALTFTPWRLLVLVMAAPLGISAFLLHFFYESPKFLVNVGRESEALEYLQRIWMRNGGTEDGYPVRRVILKEEGDAKVVTDKKTNLLVSLWWQTMPLFKPPLLWRTLLLFYLTIVIYSINNGFVMWMPYLVEAFTAGATSGAHSDSLCNIISRIANHTTRSDDVVACSSSLQSETLLSGITHGVVFAGVTLAVSKLASKKKAIMIAFLLIPLLSSLGAVFNYNRIASLLFYVGMMMTNLCMGVLFAYYVELFPTSFRGMAACLGVMVARLSGLGGVNFLGEFLMTNCNITFYACSVYLLSGIVVAAYFLPSDNPNKTFYFKFSKYFKKTIKINN